MLSDKLFQVIEYWKDEIEVDEGGEQVKVRFDEKVAQ